MKQWIMNLGTLHGRTDVWVVSLVGTLIWALVNHNEMVITLTTGYMAADFAIDRYIEKAKFDAYSKLLNANKETMENNLTNPLFTLSTNEQDDLLRFKEHDDRQEVRVVRRTDGVEHNWSTETTTHQ